MTESDAVGAPPIGAIAVAKRSLAPDLARGAMLLLIALANAPYTSTGRAASGPACGCTDTAYLTRRPWRFRRSVFSMPYCFFPGTSSARTDYLRCCWLRCLSGPGIDFADHGRGVDGTGRGVPYAG